MAEPLDDREALFRARFFEVLAIEAVGFFEARDPDDALNGHLHPGSIPSGAASIASILRTAERLPHLALPGLGAGPSLEQLLELDVRRCLTVLKLSSALAAPVLPLATVVQAWARVVGTIMHWAGKAPIVDAAIALVPSLEAMSRVLGSGELERLYGLNEFPAPRYATVEADFRPTDPKWKFWQYFTDKPGSGWSTPPLTISSPGRTIWSWTRCP